MKKQSFIGMLRRILLILLCVALLCPLLTACSITDLINRGNELIDDLGSGDKEPAVATRPSEPSGITNAPEPTNATTEPELPTETTAPVVPSVIAHAIVLVDEVPVFSTPSTATEYVKKLKYGTRVAVYVHDKGWLQLEDGWVIASSFYIEGDPDAEARGDGIVIGTGVNLRAGPGRKHAVVGSHNKPDLVRILQEFYYDDLWWGYTGKGWICMDYVYIHGTMSENYGFGTVTGDVVNIRQGPGTQHGIVKTVKKGEVLEVYNLITIKDVQWGCVNGGWICMEYVHYIKY